MSGVFRTCVLIAVRLQLNTHLIEIWSAMPVKRTDKTLFSPISLLLLPFSLHPGFQLLNFQFSQWSGFDL
jgi:hypothetical protein